MKMLYTAYDPIEGHNQGTGDEVWADHMRSLGYIVFGTI